MLPDEDAVEDNVETPKPVTKKVKKKKTPEPEEPSAESEKKKSKKKSKKDDNDNDEEENAPFKASKKFKGSKKGYVFKMGRKGLGYYVDVKPVVDKMAMDALRRSAGSHGGHGGNRRRSGGGSFGGGRNKRKGGRRSY